MAKGKKTGGRKKGSLNRQTVCVKLALDQAFSGMGGIKSFTDWAEDNPTEFYKLWIKSLPKEITGANGDPLIPKVIRILVPPAPAPQPEPDRFTLNGHVNGTH